MRRLLFAMALAAVATAVSITSNAEMGGLKVGQISPQQFICKTTSESNRLVFQAFLNGATVQSVDQNTFVGKGHLLETDYRDAGEPLQFLINDAVMRFTIKPAAFLVQYRWVNNQLVNLWVNLDEGRGSIGADEATARALVCKRARPLPR